MRHGFPLASAAANRFSFQKPLCSYLRILGVNPTELFIPIALSSSQCQALIQAGTVSRLFTYNPCEAVHVIGLRSRSEDRCKCSQLRYCLIPGCRRCQRYSGRCGVCPMTHPAGVERIVDSTNEVWHSQIHGFLGRGQVPALAKLPTLRRSAGSPAGDLHACVRLGMTSESCQA